MPGDFANQERYHFHFPPRILVRSDKDLPNPNSGSTYAQRPSTHAIRRSGGLILVPATEVAGLWFGHRVLLIDGSSFSMPDVAALQAYFGQPGNQAKGCGFPVAHILALFHAGTGLLLEVFAGAVAVA